MSGLKTVEKIESAAHASIEVETANGSKYNLTTPDEKGNRLIIKRTPIGEEIKLRGRIYGIAVETPPQKIGALLQDDRWAIPSKVVSVGQYMVILSVDIAQFTITGKITSLKMG